MAKFHSPMAMQWGGPEFQIHLRMIDGVICPFHGDAMLHGIVSVKVEQEVEGLTLVTIECYVAAPPTEEVAAADDIWRDPATGMSDRERKLFPKTAEERERGD